MRTYPFERVLETRGETSGSITALPTGVIDVDLECAQTEGRVPYSKAKRGECVQKATRPGRKRYFYAFRGSVNSTIKPPSGALTTRTVPLCMRTIRSVIARPRPVPLVVDPSGEGTR